MRAPAFRPTFDRLDARIVLDSGLVGCMVPVVGTVVASGGTSSSTDDGGGIVPATGWYQGGTPPSTTDNPTDTPIPLAFQTAGSMMTN
jgi:hypothetical protein